MTMLSVVEYFGRSLFCVLLGSWDPATKPAIALPPARKFMLFAGGLVLGLLLGDIYSFARYLCSYKIDLLNAFVWLPLGVVILTFIIDSIKDEIEKKGGQTST